jgi:peptide deformylase
MKIIQYGSDPVLTEPTCEVKEWTQKIHETARGMSRLLGQLDNAVAIAANQVGAKDSFFIHRIGGSGIHSTIINPRLAIGEKIVYDVEGCLSFPDVSCIVGRFERISVQYIAFPSMELVQEDLEGFPARVFQHEMEHLSGKTLIDNLDDEGKNEFLERYRAVTLNNRPSKNRRRRPHT